MEYKIVIMAVKAGFLGLNPEATAENFGIEITQQISLGWEPQGGVGVGGSQMAPYLFQAMIKRR
jgi:hypothetical protein